MFKFKKNWCSLVECLEKHDFLFDTRAIEYEPQRGVLLAVGQNNSIKIIYRLLKSLIFHQVKANKIGKSHGFWRAYSLFVARVASFAPERSEGANDVTRDTNKPYVRQKSFDYIIIINTQGQIVRT